MDVIQNMLQKKDFIPIVGDIGYSLKSIYSKCKKLKWDLQKNQPKALKDVLVSVQGQYLKLLKDENTTEAVDQALSVLSLINEACSGIKNIHFWKIAHPSSSHKNASLFDSAVRYNYSHQELDDLLELLFMIQNISKVYHSYGLQMEQNIKKVYESEFKSFILDKIEPIRVVLAKKNKFSLGYFLILLNGRVITYIQRIALTANFELNNTIVDALNNAFRCI